MLLTYSDYLPLQDEWLGRWWLSSDLVNTGKRSKCRRNHWNPVLDARSGSHDPISVMLVKSQGMSRHKYSFCRMIRKSQRACSPLYPHSLSIGSVLHQYSSSIPRCMSFCWEKSSKPKVLSQPDPEAELSRWAKMARVKWVNTISIQP